MSGETHCPGTRDDGFWARLKVLLSEPRAVAKRDDRQIDRVALWQSIGCQYI